MKENTAGPEGLLLSVKPSQGFKRFLRWLLGQWIFDFGAGIYNLVNSNPIWQENCAHLFDGVQGIEGHPLILDMGIGPGVSVFGMARNLSAARFIGLDISGQMLKVAGRNREQIGWSERRLALLQGNALQIPLAENSVGAAAGHSFLYLLPDHRQALREAHRVLHPGGSVAFLEPYAGKVDWGWLFRQKSARLVLSLILWRFYNWIHGRFSEVSMRHELELAGFTQINTEVTLGGFGIYGRARKP